MASLGRGMTLEEKQRTLEERLRALIRLHIEVVLSPRDREITVMLHENHPLPPSLRRHRVPLCR